MDTIIDTTPGYNPKGLPRRTIDEQSMMFYVREGFPVRVRSKINQETGEVTVSSVSVTTDRFVLTYRPGR